MISRTRKTVWLSFVRRLPRMRLLPGFRARGARQEISSELVEAAVVEETSVVTVAASAAGAEAAKAVAEEETGTDSRRYLVPRGLLKGSSLVRRSPKTPHRTKIVKIVVGTKEEEIALRLPARCESVLRAF